MWLTRFCRVACLSIAGVVNQWRASVTSFSKGAFFLPLRNFNFNRSEVKSWVYFEGKKNFQVTLTLHSPKWKPEVDQHTVLQINTHFYESWIPTMERDPTIRSACWSMKDVETVRTEEAQILKILKSFKDVYCGHREQAQGCLLGRYLYQKLGNNLNVFQQKNRWIFKYVYNKIPCCGEDSWTAATCSNTNKSQKYTRAKKKSNL